MALYLFLKGLVLGFSIAAPVGPIGILCIRRTLAGGLGSGLATGLGTATADALYGLVAALGLTAAAAFLVDGQFYLRLGGGLFLCYLGYASFRSPPSPKAAGENSASLWLDYLSAFLLTLANPLTLLSFVAVFAGLGVAAGQAYTDAGLVVGGVFSGSLLWWLILCGGTRRLGAGIDDARLIWVNRLSGLIILAFGAVCLLNLGQ